MVIVDRMFIKIVAFVILDIITIISKIVAQFIVISTVGCIIVITLVIIINIIYYYFNELIFYLQYNI